MELLGGDVRVMKYDHPTPCAARSRSGAPITRRQAILASTIHIKPAKRPGLVLFSALVPCQRPVTRGPGVDPSIPDPQPAHPHHKPPSQIGQEEDRGPVFLNCPSFSPGRPCFHHPHPPRKRTGAGPLHCFGALSDIDDKRTRGRSSSIPNPATRSPPAQALHQHVLLSNKKTVNRRPLPGIHPARGPGAGPLLCIGDTSTHPQTSLKRTWDRSSSALSWWH